MHLKVLRKYFTDKTTLGELQVDGGFTCFTLEDRIRAKGVKVKGQTAIPEGTYELTITHSNRFKKPMPLVNNVPMFEGIRIHAGNTSEDTEGCLLVGEAMVPPDSIHQSRKAFEKLFELIETGLKSGKVTIEYVNVNPPPELLAP